MIIIPVLHPFEPFHYFWITTQILSFDLQLSSLELKTLTSKLDDLSFRINKSCFNLKIASLYFASSPMKWVQYAHYFRDVHTVMQSQ